MSRLDETYSDSVKAARSASHCMLGAGSNARPRGAAVVMHWPRVQAMVQRWSFESAVNARCEEAVRFKTA